MPPKNKSSKPKLTTNKKRKEQTIEQSEGSRPTATKSPEPSSSPHAHGQQRSYESLSAAEPPATKQTRRVPSVEDTGDSQPPTKKNKTTHRSISGDQSLRTGAINKRTIARRPAAEE